MANIKLVVIPTKIKKSGECVVMMQISANHKIVRVPTEINVRPEFFQDGKVKGGAKGDNAATVKNIRLAQIKNECDLKIINNAEKVKLMDIHSLRRFLFSDAKTCSDFFPYCLQRIEEFKSNGRHNSARLLKCTYEKIKKFYVNPVLNFSDIDKKFLERFVNYCQADMTVNGIATYLRWLRVVVNEAIDDDLMTVYPFRKFEIKTETTRNRNLSIDTIRKIRDYQTEIKRQAITRDVFSLQFYLFGINIKDLFYLLPSNIVGDRLQYYRAKTGRFYNIKLEPEALGLIEKYKGAKYLLWFADHSYTGNAKVEHARQTVFQYKNQDAFARMLNDNLTLIHDDLKLKLSNPLTTYYVRHSFASIMREIDISKDDISLCLGHVNPEQHMKVTGIYINEDFIKADQANRELINFANSAFSDGKSWKDNKEQISKKQASKKRTKKNPAT